MITNRYFTAVYPQLFLLTLLVSPPVYSAPQILSVEGAITTGQTITIKGSGFTSKTNPAPLFWWRADDGDTPSDLGRTGWAGTFHGEISTAIVAPGSQQSIAWDHGLSESEALAGVDFDSTDLYVHRKYYEDFDVVENVAIRTWVKNISGTINVGETIIGETSGAVGVVVHIKPDNGVNGTSLFYSNTAGTLGGDTPTYFFEGEKMVSSSGSSMTNVEPFSPTVGSNPGVFRTFNYKKIRFWSDRGGNTATSIYIGPQGRNGNHYNIGRERTDNTLENPNFLNPLFQAPFRWNIDEVVYRASSVPDEPDARWEYSQNGVLASDETYTSRTSDRPGVDDEVFQSQVSNGAQPGSVIHYDSLYIDDSLHRVLICSGRTLGKCTTREIQIPTTWNDNQVTVQLNLGNLSPDSLMFLYIVDQNGLPNAEGFSLCPKCPLPPSPQ